ncbi:hypothetical protein HYALB_00012180 [Hymenoscyphus albidus]|uniref:Hypervirulence associated protein TUDOR domain-containing protein n=1 Tax=Hymenoscyphus albidus TaxID=595503 RepID=A0A9N9Q2Z0_9HELO|nr:hypothetical protein HYALB_00012180 [Hymenoscyphus albidus]
MPLAAANASSASHVCLCQCGTEQTLEPSRFRSVSCGVGWILTSATPCSRTLISTSVIFQPPIIIHFQHHFFFSIASHQLHRRILSEFISEVASLSYIQHLISFTFFIITFTTELSSRTSYGINMSGQVETGDKVSWKWGGGNPSGTAAEVKPDKVSITTKRGNEVTRNGEEGNPAVHIERSGNDVVKKASELTVERKGSGSGSNKQNGTSKEKKEEKADEKAEKKKEEEKEKAAEAKEDKSEEKKDEAKADTNGKEAQPGEKRKADKKADAAAEKKQENGDSKKKQKTDANGTAVSTNGAGEKKKPGRPKCQGGAAKKEKKEPAVGKAQRKTRSQGAA